MYDYLKDLNEAIRECEEAEKKAKRTYTEKEYRKNHKGSNYLGSFSINDILDTYKYTMVGEAW